MSSGQSELSTSSVIGIHHVGMSVSDLKASVEFYSEALGVDLHSTSETMQIEDVSLGFSTPSHSAVLAFPNGYLKLSEYDRSDLPPSAVLPEKDRASRMSAISRRHPKIFISVSWMGALRRLVAENSPFIC